MGCSPILAKKKVCSRSPMKIPNNYKTPRSISRSLDPLSTMDSIKREKFNEQLNSRLEVGLESTLRHLETKKKFHDEYTLKEILECKDSNEESSKNPSKKGSDRQEELQEKKAILKEMVNHLHNNFTFCEKKEMLNRSPTYRQTLISVQASKNAEGDHTSSSGGKRIYDGYSIHSDHEILSCGEKEEINQSSNALTGLISNNINVQNLPYIYTPTGCSPSHSCETQTQNNLTNDSSTTGYFSSSISLNKNSEKILMLLKEPNISKEKRNSIFSSDISSPANNNLNSSFDSGYSNSLLPKMSSFLKIKFSPFNLVESNAVTKKVFILNLKKIFLQCHKFLLFKQSQSNSNFFAIGQAKIQNFIDQFKSNNDYISSELCEILNEENKLTGMLPLYLITSNINLEIKISKLADIYTSPFTSTKKSKIATLLNDRYEILEQIATDPMWVIHKCRDKLENKHYVVKIVNKKHHKFKPSRFYFDIYTNISCNCKYVLKIIELIISETSDYLVMEYVDISLHDYILKSLRQIEIEKIWKLFRNLISSVDYCHNVAQLSIRNLTPQNIFVQYDELILKISDFYYACPFQEELIGNESEQQLEIAYPPPEMKDTSSIDRSKIDLWQCGCILYFMLYKKILCDANKIPSMATSRLLGQHISKYKINSKIRALLSGLLDENSMNRMNIEDLKNNTFITVNNEFPLPNIYDMTLDSIGNQIQSCILNRKKLKQGGKTGNNDNEIILI